MLFNLNLQHLSPREALAAPTDQHAIYTQSMVILIASFISIVGTVWIGASFAVFPQLRTFRHQLILGLAVSDFAMAFNFLLSSSHNVSGRLIGAPEQAKFCSFNGFMTQLFVVQTDYWVLTIAICTYLILADHRRSSVWIQGHLILLWAFPWLLSSVLALIGLLVLGYGDIGAWCWFTSDAVRLYVNFVQRWAIVAVMMLLYARLYYLLFRAHRHWRSFGESDSTGGATGDATGGTGSGVGSGHYARALSGQHRRLKKLARLMLLYPVAYAIIWTLPTCIRIYQTITGQSAPWQIQTIDKACIVLQGFIDAIIYGWTESSFASWRNLLFPRQKLDGEDHVDGPDQLEPAQTTIQLQDRHQRNSQTLRNKRRDNEIPPVSSSSSMEPLDMSNVQLGMAGGGGITKTVKVEITSSNTADADSHKGSEAETVDGEDGIFLALQRPEKPYFPGGP
ncbi:hypothetical protein QBC44DRAFT_323920 [Cladorrhinum sp. PSN332]|nr:hypothetical protein QBC44DRAFT_323920 [Cladorrhinum sp. PSN332]